MMYYFDNNATTPVLPEVLEKMLPCFNQFFGNASSKTHAYGWQADELVKNARLQIAEAIGAETSEIYFTSGATESISLALQIVAENYAEKGKHIITCKTEHKAMLDELSLLEKKGFEIEYLEVDNQGLISIEKIRNAIKKETIALSVMHVNNETGLIQPIDEISKICEAHHILFISDCTQSLGKVEINVKQQKIAMACFSAHKLNGPKGVGTLYISRKNPRVKITKSQLTGVHENGIRAGTLNVPGIVGMGEAARLAHQNLTYRIKHLTELRNLFEKHILKHFKVTVNSGSADRVANTSNICFENFSNTEIIKLLPEIAFSTGSACTSANNEPSHVLQAMQVNAKHSVRFSFGVQNTEKEILEAVELMRKRLG